MSIKRQIWQGALAIFPLSIAVIPWGFLVGSFATDIGLTVIESQALSVILFAGSAQLVAVGMFKAGVGLSTMLLTTFFYLPLDIFFIVSQCATRSVLFLLNGGSRWASY